MIAQDLNVAEYLTHSFKRERQMTDYGTGFEYLRVCKNCGLEDQGHPAEFPDIQYPNCGDMSD
jgi:hypothetical protein